jgi:hypothetical protein
VLLAACALIAILYCANSDMGGRPDAPRGTGEYLPVLARGDGHMTFLIARSMAFDFDWVFDNDLARFGDPWREPITATGRKAIVQTLGPALLWTPLLWLAQVGAVIGNTLGAGIELHGYTAWHQRIAFSSSVVLACFAVLLGRRAARALGCGPWASAYGAAAVLLGTSLTYYATHMPSYSHALDAGAAAGFLGYWALTIGRRDARRQLALGALLGLAMLVRAQAVGLAVVVAIEHGRGAVAALVAAARAEQGGVARRGALVEAAQWAGGAACIGAVAVVVFSPQLLAWHVVFGDALALPQGPRYTRLEAPMVGELLFSARNGWLATHPVAYAGLVGLCVAPRRARWPAAGLLAAVAVQVLLSSAIVDWLGSAAFGQRRLCNLTLPLVVGVAALLSRVSAVAARLRVRPRARHAIAVAALAPLVAWNLREVIALRAGRPAPSEHRPTCCARIPAPLRGAAQWIYDRVGNPFQLPASAAFALAHDVPLKRWDELVGRYPIVPPWAQLADEQLTRHRGVWAIGERALDAAVVRGLSAPVRAPERAARWTTGRAAKVLVPNLFPYGQRFALWVAPGGATRVTLRFEGEVVAAAELTGWTRVVFELAAPPLHTNELVIESEPGPAPPRPGWPAAPGPVGVAVGALEVTFLGR